MAPASDARGLAVALVEANMTLRPDEAQALVAEADALAEGVVDGARDDASTDAGFVADSVRGILGIRTGRPGAVDLLRRALATHLGRRPHPDVALSQLGALVAFALTRPQDVRRALGPHAGHTATTPRQALDTAWLLGLSDIWVGDLPRGMARLREAVDLAAAQGVAPELALSHMLLGKALSQHGDVPGARRHLVTSREVAASAGAVELGNGHLECSAYLPLVEGDDEGFLARLELLGSPGRGGLSGLGPEYRLELATALAVAGDRQRARALTRDLQQGVYAGRPVSPLMRAWADWASDVDSPTAVSALGHVAVRPEDPAECWPALRATWLLGSHHARRGRRGDAIRLLESAGERATAMGALGYVRLIESEVAALVRSPAPAAAARNGTEPPTAAALTPAERRVAHAVCGGLSNREVAELLVLSERTVEAHLTSIFRKLSVRNRTELAVRL